VPRARLAVSRGGGPAWRARSAADEGGAQLRGRLSTPPVPGAAAEDEGEWHGVVGAAVPYPPPPLGHRARPPTPLLLSHTRPPKPPLRHCARPPTLPLCLLWPPSGTRPAGSDRTAAASNAGRGPRRRRPRHCPRRARRNRSCDWESEEAAVVIHGSGHASGWRGDGGRRSGRAGAGGRGGGERHR
jgi:hypothetical protein